MRGCEVTVLSDGTGASHLPVGLLAAHLSAQDIPLSQLSRIGVQLTLVHARALLREGIDWQPCSLEQRLLGLPSKNERLRQGAATLPDWYEVQPDHVLHTTAAWIKPQALAAAWLAQPGIRVQLTQISALRNSGGLWQVLNAQGEALAQADQLIIAAGVQTADLLQSCGLDLNLALVDGSVALGAWPHHPCQQQPAHVVNGNGHFIGGVPDLEHGAMWLSGATYDRETYASPAAREAANLQANQERLASLLPADLLQAINAQFTKAQVRSWQGSRCTTSDRFPAVGQLAAGLHVCTAMGSRGLSFSALCGELLASEITATEPSVLLSADLRQEIVASRNTCRAACN